LIFGLAAGDESGLAAVGGCAVAGEYKVPAGGDGVGIQQAPGHGLQFAEHEVPGQAPAIRAVRGHRIVDVRDGENPCLQQDLLAG
jgi:hypothetical protein